MELLIIQTLNLFTIFLVSVQFFLFCAKKKAPAASGPIKPPVGPNQTKSGGNSKVLNLNEAQKNGGGTTGLTATKSATGNTAKSSKKGEEDDDDDVKFNLNIKKPEEKKDEFDDDEENPLAKIPTKPRKNKAKQTPKAASAAPKTKTSEDPIHMESPLLAPNEKHLAVSCYQFEPSATAPTPVPAPATTPATATKKTTANTVKTDMRTVQTIRPNTIENQVNAKSAMSLNLRKNRTKSVEQEPNTHNDVKLEKTQN